jgi:predicted Zn-dependent protease
MKKLFILGVALIVLGAGLWLGRAPYRNWKQRHYLVKAQDCAAKGDLAGAVENARKSIETNPKNIDACRLMATITEQIRRPEAVLWRRRIVELEPDSLQNRLDLAKTALLLNDAKEARQVLTSIQEAGRNRSDFHELVAALAMAENNLQAAQQEAATALKLDPQNKNLQLNLAVLNLQSDDKQVVQGARKSLEQLATDPAYAHNALRQLTGDALKRQEYASAQPYAQRLLATKEATFDDQLLNLAILKGAQSASFSTALAAVEKQVATNPIQINALAGWLGGRKMTDMALQWLLSLPDQTRQEPQVTLAIADCYAQQQDWARVQTLLSTSNWKELEYVRFALLARADKGLRNDTAEQANWHTALKTADGREQPLATLARMASTWGWNRECEEAAWPLVQKYPQQRWAVEMLGRYYTTNGNTRALQKMYSGLLEADANDIMFRNNFAAVSLLLGTGLPEAEKIASEDYEKLPQNPFIVSTYAFSLYIQGKAQDGLNVLEKLPGDALHNPGIAAYYGTLLAAAGQPAKAREYLQLSQKAALLPEERAMVAAAQKAAPPQVK